MTKDNIEGVVLHVRDKAITHEERVAVSYSPF